MFFFSPKFSRHLQLTDDIREYLRQPTFDNWQWEDAEMMLLLQQMYIDLDFIAKFNIEVRLEAGLYRGPTVSN